MGLSGNEKNSTMYFRHNNLDGQTHILGQKSAIRSDMGMWRS